MTGGFRQFLGVSQSISETFSVLSKRYRRFQVRMEDIGGFQESFWKHLECFKEFQQSAFSGVLEVSRGATGDLKELQE